MVSSRPYLLSGPLPPCPLCGTPGKASPAGSYPYETIWALLAEEWGARIPADVVRRLTPREDSRLLECTECGLQFFDPLVGGDSEFYRELGKSPSYYVPYKWEFGWVADRLSPDMEILDVGCGRGDFLALVKPGVRRAVGLEQNRDAAVVARSRDLEVAVGDLTEYSGDHSGSFDAVCSFHVLEHLGEVRPFVRLLLRCLKPGGSLFLSVPNRERYWKKPVEPLDCPPHHLTRWSPAQFRALGELPGLRLRELAFEPVDVNMLREEIPLRIRRTLGKVPLAGEFLGLWSTRILARTVFREFCCSRYSRTRLFDRLGFRGMSMVAHGIRMSG